MHSVLAQGLIVSERIKMLVTEKMHNLNIESYVLSGSLPWGPRPTRQLLKEL